MEDYAEVFLRFNNGTNSLATVSWGARIPIYHVELVGQYGRKIFTDPMDPFNRSIFRAGLSFVKNTIFQRYKGRPPLLLDIDPYYCELEYFLIAL